ncbi:septation protein A [Variovorax sp. PAMC 28711]|uniref:septation protein A n=1 Tax=Variovorax sp. PAMC 28711 TaxID=1795631 RepID=UPI00078EAB70|nr:septation protein A [Variovorax sp. PAMC 28711]AMM26408.1 septation protein A [Variovorax sp. PAMC 28711]
MKLLIDFFPIVLFFGAYKFADIYTATGVLMGATVLQMVIIYLREHKLQAMQKATLVLILLFGTLTLVLHDDRFIKWKPTVLYSAMAIGLAVAYWVVKKNFLQVMLGQQLQLPDRIWTHLNIAWIGYCVFMAAINAYVATYFSTEAWVNFKLWGYAFPIVFLIAQGLYISPHMKSDEPAA